MSSYISVTTNLNQSSDLNGKENFANTLNNPEHFDQIVITTTQPKEQAPEDIGTRKSKRPRKTPIHLSESITDPNTIGKSIQKRILKSAAVRSQTPKQQTTSTLLNKQKQNVFPDFRCDHCGSRYVVNPMRRGNKISATKYKATPRHKIDPETQKILTLCNACGLKFGRLKKGKQNRETLTEEDQKKFQEEGEIFARELSIKLEDELEAADVDEILTRGRAILNVLLKAVELKKLKCYDPVTVENIKVNKKGIAKIGLGNGQRKSKEFEDFVLKERLYLRDELKFCEKATQKILSYSNNFLHKRLKTDPEKGIRIERQKGKAALGTLKPVGDLPLESCCVDNCVRMALTHGRLLEKWRERAISSQVEARRVLAEMLTPSGGNRANCYRFVSWVTGCSNTTIGKVNEQMKNTGGDREPPEHGLKKYFKDNPKNRKIPISIPTTATTFIPSYQILETAVNSAGLSNMMQDRSVPPQSKKIKRQSKAAKSEKVKNMVHSFAPTAPPRISGAINIVPDNSENSTTNLQNISAAVLALNGNYQNAGFISIPAGLATGNAITLPSGLSLQATQQQLQQQQLQLQIQMLQQQLQNNQAAATQHAVQQANDEYMVAVSNPLEQQTVQQIGTPIVVQSVTTQPVVQNVIAQSILPNTLHSETVLPTIVAAHSTGSINFVSSGHNNVLQQHNVETTRNTVIPTIVAAHSTGSINFVSSNHNLLPHQNKELTRINHNTSLTNTGGIGIIASNNLLAHHTNLVDNSVSRASRSLADTLRPVHLITSQSPTMAISQPISLHNPATFSLSTLPTMLLTQTTNNEPQQQQHQQLIIHPTSHQQHSSEQLIIQRPLSSHSISDHVVLHQSNVQSSSEQVAVNASSVLPSMTSFNADAFFTNGGNTTYTVINNGELSQIQSNY